ncbi:MAG TPA: class I SAM-dependent methyltransferase [Puia sp.]|jgi:SAM-dependent methyltransferase|nr:class I SAM-dependent methyltransferase [Puia sp.]
MNKYERGHEDPGTGQETLEIFAHTERFNRWMFGHLSRWCRGHVLEIGSGIGNLSAMLLEEFDKVSLSDIRSDYCDVLCRRFGGLPNLDRVFRMDMGEPDLEGVFPELPGKFDSILSSNVVEHVKDDLLAIKNCHAMLRPGGRLVVLVPAFGSLYNSFDELLGHYRRYNRKGLSALLRKGGFTLVESHYFNAVGIAGWWFSGVVLGKKKLPEGQLALYNRLVPLVRMADALTFHRIGLSVIAVGEKI